MLTNYHCHTQFCDGRANAEDFVKAAIDFGFAKLGFSSHSPVPYTSRWNMKEENAPEYFNEIKRLTKAYSGEIEILTGMEVDYIPGIFGAHSPFITNNRFDYLIGSIHYLDCFDDGTPWTIDGPAEWFDKGMNEIFGGDHRRVVKRFVDISCEMMQAGGFDIVGHIDKIYQHGHRYFSHNEKCYVDLVRSMLVLAKEKNVIVEINTKSVPVHGFFYPHQDFFKMLVEIGNRVTVNSDTHQPHLMNLAFTEAYEALSAAGVTHLYELINGAWQPCILTNKGIVV